MDPVLVSVPSAYFYCNRDPAANEPTIPPNISSEFRLGWWNSANNTWFMCVDWTPGSMVWQNVVMGNPWPAILPISGGGTGASTAQEACVNLGIVSDTPRSYTLWSEAAFGAARAPSPDHDTAIIATVNIVNTLLTSATITLQVNAGSGWVTVATESLSALLVTVSRSFFGIIPAASQYKIVATGSAGMTLTSVQELSL